MYRYLNNLNIKMLCFFSNLKKKIAFILQNENVSKRSSDRLTSNKGANETECAQGNYVRIVNILNICRVLKMTSVDNVDEI